MDELRMRPMEKYLYQLENIRLAEKLLVVKASPELSRRKQKKFYL
jgi:hypothetical protein